MVYPVANNFADCLNPLKSHSTTHHDTGRFEFTPSVDVSDHVWSFDSETHVLNVDIPYEEKWLHTLGCVKH